MSNHGRFSAFAGQIGSTPNYNGFRFAPSANPYANAAAGIPAQSFGPRPLVLRRPVAATATVAGRVGVGCCSGCAADHRKI